MSRPHVVLLGAGASLAAFPDGEASGRRLPVLNDLVQTIPGLQQLIAEAKVSPAENFENAYSRIRGNPDLASVATRIEEAVRVYFSEMRLPDRPTLYDHLVLCLRQKDVIATFNWDPLLAQACQRNAHVAEPPKVLFLHGNTGVGFCESCSVLRPAGQYCSSCGGQTEATPLLYPIERKDYSSHPFIRAEWGSVRHELKQAYMFTIFGYSAPVSDAEALALLRDGWGRAASRNLEEIEIINVTPPDQLRDTWRDFIHTEHYRVTDSFYKSWIARHPRRSCESMWSMLMERNWNLLEKPVPVTTSWGELWAWFERLRAQEDDAA
jgi:hypothetical protein